MTRQPGGYRCPCCGGPARIDPARLGRALGDEGFSDRCFTVAGLQKHADLIDGPLREVIEGFSSRRIGKALLALSRAPDTLEDFELVRTGLDRERVVLWLLMPVVS